MTSSLLSQIKTESEALEEKIQGIAETVNRTDFKEIITNPEERSYMISQHEVMQLYSLRLKQRARLIEKRVAA